MLDTAPNVTRAISALTPHPAGAVEIGAFVHPTRPAVAGTLVRYTASGRYAIVSGRTATSVPKDWAKVQEARACRPFDVKSPSGRQLARVWAITPSDACSRLVAEHPAGWAYLDGHMVALESDLVASPWLLTADRYPAARHFAAETMLARSAGYPRPWTWEACLTAAELALELRKAEA